MLIAPLSLFSWLRHRHIIYWFLHQVNTSLVSLPGRLPELTSSANKPDQISQVDRIIFSNSVLNSTVLDFHLEGSAAATGIRGRLVSGHYPYKVTVRPMSLCQQAQVQPVQGSPGSAATDSAGATPNSPRSPSTPTWVPQSFSLQHAVNKINPNPPLSTVVEGRCTGPRGQDSVGDQVSMSQQGPVSQHASRRSSRSPTGDEQISPSSVRYNLASSHEVRPNQADIPRTNGDHRVQQIPPRTLDVHNILNPSEAQLSGPGGSADFRPSPRSLELAATISTPGATPGPFSATRSFFAGQTTSMSLPGTPIGPATPLAGSASERNSPTTSFPFPAINPRMKISPGPPRASSLSHARSPHELENRPLPSLPSASPAKRPYEVEGEGDVHSQTQGRSSMLPGSQIAAAAPSRSSSQPVMHSPRHPHLIPPIGNTPMRLPPQQIPVQSTIPGGPPINPTFPGAGPPSEAGSSWSDMIRRHGMGGAMIAEGQQAFMTLPGSDAPIPVVVDYSQASKKADEKRQRNAVASTRHRKKKKIMQEENTKQLQDLRDDRRRMEIEIENLTRQRDFYKAERNRLREVVMQAPGLQRHAVGPPSPSSTGSPFAERSPLMSGPQAPSSAHGYASEPSSAERPAQRRRIDDHPEFSTPVYGAPGGGPPSIPSGPTSGHPSSTGLSPMQGHIYGVPPRPSSATSSGSVERLPPLRSMEGPPPGPSLGPGQGQEQDPRTGQWIPVQPRQQETGWATYPRRQ